jgi:hypothetical protein
VNTDDVSDLLFYVDNTGPAGDVEIAAGSYSPAIRQGLGIAYIPFGGTATGVFRIEGARHVQGGQVFINFDSNMTGFVYCFRAKSYGAGQTKYAYSVALQRPVGGYRVRQSDRLTRNSVTPIRTRHGDFCFLRIAGIADDR